MRHRCLVLLALVMLLCGPGAQIAWDTRASRSPDPIAGSALGDTPTAIRLTFSENPQASLSSIRVVDANGQAPQVGPARAVPGRSALHRHPRATARPRRLHGDLASRLRDRRPRHGRRLRIRRRRRTDRCRRDDRQHERRRFAARDGGALGFPDRARRAHGRRRRERRAVRRLAGRGPEARSRRLARVSRRARPPRRGPASRSRMRLPARCCTPPVGHALVWRGVALGAAGAALLVARRASGRRRRVAMGGAALAALAAMVVHVSAGHAATGTWPHWPVGGSSVRSFRRGGNLDRRAGGTAARPARRPERRQGGGDPPLRDSSPRPDSSRSPSPGTARAVEELTSWRDLASTGYGRAVVAKIALLLTIGAIAARNRLRSVPAAGENLSPVAPPRRAPSSCLPLPHSPRPRCSGASPRLLPDGSSPARNHRLGLRLALHARRPAGGGFRSARPEPLRRPRRRLRRRTSLSRPGT